jgi:hypothetical protein
MPACRATHRKEFTILVYSGQQTDLYKLCVSVGVSRAVLAPVKAVFDTGAGPNLVREGILPKGWERFLIPNQPLPRINDASGKRMPVRGVITLYVQVGDLVTRVRFYVVPGLGTHCILGCNFINLHVRSIHPKERRVDLNEGGSVAITSGIDAENAASAKIREPAASTKVRLSRKTAISPRCEAHVEVTSVASGLYQIFHHTKPSATAITLASGIAEIRPNVPFWVRVINPTNRAHSLSKGMVIGIAAAAPARVFSLDAHGAKFCEPPQGYSHSSEGLYLTDSERELSQSRRTSGTLMQPKGSHDPVWRQKFCESRTAVANLEMGQENLHEGQAESAQKEHKKKNADRRVRARRCCMAGRGLSRALNLPMNGSRYYACWSRITVCGTAAWERWPPRLTESRSSPVPSPYTHSRTAPDLMRGSLKRPK